MNITATLIRLFKAMKKGNKPDSSMFQSMISEHLRSKGVTWSYDPALSNEANFDSLQEALISSEKFSPEQIDTIVSTMKRDGAPKNMSEMFATLRSVMGLLGADTSALDSLEVQAALLED